ncbi:MAG: hypothetical protein PHF86_12985 [Candidatus Nanoarchaeia archaeon]|nr:hypothetical protein [Candidatus Nanoarchaeia archaeon]
MLFKKILSISFVIITILTLILFVTSKISYIYFWIILGICAIFAYILLPKLK